MTKLALPQDVKKRQMVILVGAVGGLILVVLFGLWMSDPNRGKPDPRDVAKREAEQVEKQYDIGQDAITAEESWIARSEGDLHTLRRSNQELETQLKLLQDQMKLMKEEQSNSQVSPSGLPPAPQSTLPPPPPPPSAPQNNLSTREQVANNVLPPPPTAVNQGQKGDKMPAGTIQVVSLSETNPDGSKEETKNVSSYLPTGAFATTVLLSGIDAPTGGQAQTNPVPVLLRLMDDGQLPNYWNSDVRDCHVVGAAYGEISSERAHIRLETLSCVLSNGDVVEVPVKGYVAGEDGKAGLRGRLVTKQGQLLAKSLLAGILSGGANSIQQQHQQTATSALGTVTSIDPNRVVEAGLASGVSNSMEKLADFYIARANEMYPIIEVDANRIGEVVLTGGTDMGKNLIGNTRDGAEE